MPKSAAALDRLNLLSAIAFEIASASTSPSLLVLPSLPDVESWLPARGLGAEVIELTELIPWPIVRMRSAQFES